MAELGGKSGSEGGFSEDEGESSIGEVRSEANVEEFPGEETALLEGSSGGQAVASHGLQDDKFSDGYSEESRVSVDVEAPITPGSGDG